MRTRSKSREYRRKCDQARVNMEETPSPPIPKLPSKRRGRTRSQSKPTSNPLTAVEGVPAEPQTKRGSSPKVETVQRQVATLPIVSVPATETGPGLSVPNVGKRSVSPGEGVRPNRAFQLRVEARPQ